MFMDNAHMTVIVIEGLFGDSWVPLSKMYFKSELNKAEQRLSAYRAGMRAYSGTGRASAYRLAEYQRVTA